MRELAKAWIALQYETAHTPEHDKYFWAFERMRYLLEQDPEECWVAINTIREMDSSDKILASVAAGPLEDLLVLHGQMFIDRVEHLAETDQKFRRLLGAVWQHDIRDDIWQRVRAVAGPSF